MDDFIDDGVRDVFDPLNGFTEDGRVGGLSQQSGHRR